MEKFLVIDDSTTIQKVVQLAFAPYAVEIVPSYSYIEAINSGSQNLPQLVIADASLPGIKGAEDYGELRKRLNNVPFVILIGTYDDVDQASFHRQGFDTFLAKPFDAADLVAAVWSSLGRELGPKNATVGAPPPPPPMQGAEGESDGHQSMPPPPPPMQALDLDDKKPPPPPSSPMSTIDISDVPIEGGTLTSPTPIKLKKPAVPPVKATENIQPPPLMGSDDEEFEDGDDAEDQYSFDLDFEPESSTDAEINHDDQYSDDDLGHTDYSSTDVSEIETEHADSEDLDENDHVVVSIADRDGSAYASIEQEGSFSPPPPPPEEDEAVISGDRFLDPEEDDFLEKDDSEEAPIEDMDRVHGLLEPFLRDEMAKIVEKTVIDYCERHFAKIAREIITKEIKSLSSEKSRLLSEK